MTPITLSNSVLDGRAPLITAEIAVGTRDWKITAVQNQDVLLDIVQADDLEQFPYGLLLWESAVGLARYMTGRPETVAGLRVLELGTGVGVAGIAAAYLGAKVSQTDYQKGVLQLAQRNAAQNNVPDIRYFLADWRRWTHHEVYDVLLGADIMYERATHYYLGEIFSSNLAPGGTILLSDPGRPQSLEFAALLEKHGWRINIDTEWVSLGENGQAGGPIDVTILTVSRQN